MNDPALAPHLDPGRRRKLTLLVVPIVVVAVAATLADWFAAAIVTHHPLLEMFLNPRTRYFALAANHVDTSSYYTVGFIRLVLTDPFWYLLGRWYGEDAIRWIDNNLGGGRLIRTLERWFASFSYPIVFYSPGGIVCLLAGATGMRPTVFIILNVAGTIARLVVIRAIADVLEGPLDAVGDFIARYQWPIVAISIAIGLVQLERRRRRRAAPVAKPSEPTVP